MRLRKYKTTKKRWIAFFTLAAITILLTLLKRIEAVSEHIFTQGFSRAWVFVFGHISSLFPFSLFEVFIVIAVGYTVASITIWIVCAAKKNGYLFKQSFSVFCLVVMSIFTVYSAVASPAYYRAESNEIPFASTLSAEEVFAMSSWYYSELNSLAAKFERNEETNRVVSPYTFDELSQKMAEEYKRFDGNYLSSYTPRAKPSFLTFMWKEFRILGIAFLPLGEGVMHADSAPVYLVHTMAHELAHTKGVMKENDANLLAYYVTFSAEDDFIRYCAMLYLRYDLWFMVKQYPGGDLVNSLMEETAHPGIFADEYEVPGYWPKLNLFAYLSSFFNNLYLKLSGVKDGMDSYEDKNEQLEIVPLPPVDPSLPTPPTLPPFFTVMVDDVQKMMISVYQSQTEQR